MDEKKPAAGNSKQIPIKADDAVQTGVYSNMARISHDADAFIVDFVDRESRKLLWRGAIMAEITIVDSDTVKERRARLCVQLLLDHFPKPIEDESGAVSMSPR